MDGEHVEGTAFECPGCGERVEAVVGEVARMVECPACGEALVIPGADGSTDLPEAGGEEERGGESGELDSLRVRHMIVARRTAIRTRTYFVAGAVTCLTGVAEMVIMTVTEVRAVGWHVRQMGFVVAAVVGGWAGIYSLRRAAYWGRQGRPVQIPEPELPPDFSTLSDGSQHARNLEKLH
jgi:predicted RNA-binding Zn-ribbon protein involved in translation (DUF1610 family)